MIFTPTAVDGVVLVDLEPAHDARGFFARAWCAREFAARGLDGRLVQCGLSVSKTRGTLRGLHYQLAPRAEAKIIRCTRGAIYDVVLDLRRSSPTFLRHVAVTLTVESRTMIYAPPGCAHGFQTLEDDVEVFYQMSEVYALELQRGVRWDDPSFGIDWPEAERVMSERDRSYPDFRAERDAAP